MDEISTIMSSPVIVLGPNDTLARARHLMLRDRINRLVVIDQSSKPIGILTRGDIARETSSRNPGREGSYDQTLVGEVMSKSPVTLKPSDSVLKAAQIMLRKGISGAPLVDDAGKLIGILTKSDLTLYYEENCARLVKISEVETREVTTIPPSYTLYRAEETMQREKIGRLIVVNGKTPIGIITQRDLSFAKYQSRGPQDKFRRTRTIEEGETVRNVRLPEEAIVRDIMRSPPIDISEDEDVVDAAKLMIEHSIGGVPVVNDQGELTGIITKTDLTKALIIYESRTSDTEKTQ